MLCNIFLFVFVEIGTVDLLKIFRSAVLISLHDNSTSSIFACNSRTNPAGKSDFVINVHRECQSGAIFNIEYV